MSVCASVSGVSLLSDPLAIDSVNALEYAVLTTAEITTNENVSNLSVLLEFACP